jgi:hypothetical protein
MFKPNFVAVGVIALSTQLACLVLPLAAPAANDSTVSQDTTTKPTKTDKKLKKGSKTEKREKADTKKDSLSPAGGSGPPSGY